MHLLKHTILVALICGLSLSGYTQDSTLVATDSAAIALDTMDMKKRIEFPWAITIEGQFESMDTQFEDNINIYYGIGLEYKRFLGGFYYRELISNDEEMVIFPSSFSLHSSSGGVYLGYRMIDRKLIGVSGRMLIGSGDILWSRIENQEDFARDKFTELKPEILLEFEPTIFTQLYLSIGYKFVSDFDIPSFDNNETSGLMFNAGLKLGFFYKYDEEK